MKWEPASVSDDVLREQRLCLMALVLRVGVRGSVDITSEELLAAERSNMQMELRPNGNTLTVSAVKPDGSRPLFGVLQ